MSMKRTYVIEPVLDEFGEMQQQRAKAQQLVDDLLSTVWSVGGVIRIVADRVKIGELEGEAGRMEPMGETVGLVVEWSGASPLNKQSITVHMMDRITGEPGEPDELEDEPAAPEPQAATSLAAAVDGGVMEDDGGGIPVQEGD